MKQIWQCPKCGCTFSEYINGCPHHNEENTPISVELVIEIKDK